MKKKTWLWVLFALVVIVGAFLLANWGDRLLWERIAQLQAEVTPAEWKELNRITGELTEAGPYALIQWEKGDVSVLCHFRTEQVPSGATVFWLGTEPILSGVHEMSSCGSDRAVRAHFCSFDHILKIRRVVGFYSDDYDQLVASALRAHWKDVARRFPEPIQAGSSSKVAQASGS